MRDDQWQQAFNAGRADAEASLRDIEAAITQYLRDWEGSTCGDAFSIALGIVQRRGK